MPILPTFLAIRIHVKAWELLKNDEGVLLDQWFEPKEECEKRQHSFLGPESQLSSARHLHLMQTLQLIMILILKK